MTLAQLAAPIHTRFVALFSALFSRSANERFLSAVERALEKRRWKRVVQGFREAARMASAKLKLDRGSSEGMTSRQEAREARDTSSATQEASAASAASASSVGRSNGSAAHSAQRREWNAFERAVGSFEQRVNAASASSSNGEGAKSSGVSLSFAFVEGERSVRRMAKRVRDRIVSACG